MSYKKCFRSQEAGKKFTQSINRLTMKKQVLLAMLLGINVAVFAQTTMTLEGTQTNTGAKTFLNGSLQFRNVANTFSGSFTNTITANRTYTLPNASGTLALTSNLTWPTITGKPTTIAGYGITDFNSLGDSRWWKLSGTNTLTGATNLFSGGNTLIIGDQVGSQLAFTASGYTLSSINAPALDYAEVQVTPSMGVFRWISNDNQSNQGIYNGPLATYLSFGSTVSAVPEINGINSFIKLASGGITINDGINSRGLVNAANYFANYTDRTIPDWGNVKANLLGAPLAAPTATEAGKSVRWNAAGTAWEYFTPGGGGAFTGTSGQIPFANATNDGLTTSDGLTFLSATKQFITGNNNSAPSGTNTFTSGEGNVNKGRYGSAMFGEGSEIETNVGAAIAGGEGVYIAAYGGHAMGRGTSIRAGAFYSYSGGWWEPGTTLGKTNLKVPQVSGTSSFGYYSTDPNQVDNHGVRANSSAILGGKNSDIPPGSNYSVVLGGQEIKARANDPNQVYVPNFNIVTAPALDNALTQVMVRDGTTGQIKYRDANTLGGTGVAGSDFTNSAELGYYSFIKGTVSGVTQVPHLAFRSDVTRTITDGVTDVYLGPNNGNTASAAGGNIGIGSHNLNQINAGGTWTGTPYYSYFRGDRNIAIGFQNGMNLTGGTGNAASTNILIGNSVLKASTQQSYNIFIGFQSAMNMSIPLNGFNGQSNVALGQYNMQNVTSGTASFNTAIGASVLRATTSINSSNTFIGSGAGLNAQIVGSFNTVVGDDGFRDITWTTSGNSYNTGLGSTVFRNAVEGLNNSTAVGTSSMRWGGGSDNAAVGRASGWTLRGSGNTAIGFQSAHVADNSYTTTAGTPYAGNNSTFIGYRAGYKSADAAVGNVIVIGNDFQPTLQAGNVYLGSSNELVAFAAGTEKLRISSAGATIKDGNLTIDNNSNGGNPSIYLGSGSLELNRYLQVTNSADLLNSSGLKAGGILVADSYTYANPSKNDLVVKGKVGIGTALLTNPNNYTLAVNGKIGAKDVQVETSSTTWPDYVFNATYQLPSLQSVEKFIQENKHLENVPSAAEVEENGHSLGEMDKILLKKVEELTLYIIQQQKEIDELKKKIGEK
jgi:hypothetical protein